MAGEIIFKIGERYRNRKGWYEVLDIEDDKIKVCYEIDGDETVLSIEIQKRIISNISQEEESVILNEDGKEKDVNRVTRANVTKTPIKDFLKNKISDEMIRYLSNFPPFISRQVYKDKRLLNEVQKDFYSTVKKLADEISGKKEFEKAQELESLNKYEMCVISGIREMQKELGIRPNLNHVKYKLVKKLLTE